MQNSKVQCNVEILTENELVKIVARGKDRLSKFYEILLTEEQFKELKNKKVLSTRINDTITIIRLSRLR